MYRVPLSSLLIYFNSIKVRLKLYSDIALSDVSEFQFHKGTIKTQHDNEPLYPVRQFQFHKGTIKTLSST